MDDMLLSEMVKRAAKPELLDQVSQEVPSEIGPSKAAQLAFLAGLGADVGTTAYGAHKGLTTEANPLIKWAGNKGAAPVTAGLGLGTLLLSKMLGKSHPKIANAILYGMGGAHGVAAMSNVNQMHKPQQPQAYTPKPSTEYINPDYFPGLK